MVVVHIVHTRTDEITFTTPIARLACALEMERSAEGRVTARAPKGS